MTVKGAFDQIATWTITGVTVLGLDDLNAPPGEADLPLLVPELAGTGGEAFRPLGISAEAGEVVVFVWHKLLIRGVGLASHSERFYGALTHVDNYLAQVNSDWFLGGNLLKPLAIADTVPGLIEVLGGLYYGIQFRHRWVIKVT